MEEKGGDVILFQLKVVKIEQYIFLKREGKREPFFIEGEATGRFFMFKHRKLY